jgi:hypothetical protein
MLLTFDSLPEFVARIKSEEIIPGHRGDAWTANISFDEAIDLALHGEDSYVKEANKLIDQLSLAMPMTRAFKTIKSPYGGRCSFSDWQKQTPTPMRRRIRSNTDFGPIKIVVSTTSSQGIDAPTMAKRGSAILALLLKLQEVRPIELYLLAELYGHRDGWHYQQIRVESKPLDIAVAAFVLCNVGFARHLTYDLASKLDGFDGTWPKGYKNDDYAQRRAERLGLTEEDIMIKEVYLDDKLVQKPLEWLQEQLRKYQEV